MKSFRRPYFRAAVILAAIALPLAGCGRRGPLEPPPGAAVSGAPLTGVPDEDRRARMFPDALPQTAGGALDAGPVSPQNEAPAVSTPPARAPSPAAAPQRKPFILDPLL